MRTHLFWGCLVAALATGCHSSPTPGEPTGSGPVSQSTPLASATTQPAAASPTPRAQALRLHDAAMARMDALYSERRRLSGQLAKLTPTTPASQRRAARLRRTVAALAQADTQMMAWMHELHEPDSTRQPGAQVTAYWQQQLPVLRQVDQRITTALDSARALR